DLRLLYVALTRAKHACWLGIADLKRGNNSSSVLHLSALGYLLGAGASLSESAALARWLLDLQAGCAAIDYGHVPEAQDSVFHPPRNEATLPAPLLPKRKAAENWWIASYSALRIGDSMSAASLEAPESPQAQKLFDDERLDPDAPREVVASGGDIHRFPRGPNPGTFLHGLLEWAGEEGFNVTPEAIEKAVGARCNRRNWEGWIVTLSGWLGQLLRTPFALDNALVTLNSLQHYQIEMEFWFASHKVDVLALDKWVCQFTHNGASRVAAEAVLLNGMFK
ncbi:exodeoxyribonuclease V subunit beta, partial [Corynebacterium propinquum]